MRRFQLRIFAIVGAATAAVGLTILARGGPEQPVAAELPIVVLLAVVVGAMVSAVVARMSLEPLGAVRDLARDLAAGRRDARLLWSYGDERDATAAAFNQMADQLGHEIESARRDAQRLEAVMGAMAEGVLVLDLSDRIRLVNRGFRDLFGVWGDVDGRLILEVIRQTEVDDLLREARERGEPVFRAVEIRSGGDRTMLAHAVPFPTDGPPAGTLAVFHDVTEVRRVDRIRRDFIANASHELRTPLTSIQGYAEALSSSGLAEADRARALETIQRNVVRMRDLIDDLMELSRIEHAGRPLERSRVDLVRLAHELLGDHQKRIQGAGLVASIKASAPTIALCDRAGAHHVLENLLTNAIRYSDEGGRITLHLSPTKAPTKPPTEAPAGAFVEVIVEDTGIGIPEDARERIFERFYRVDASRSRAVGSTGLGLSIVRHLVQGMGGTIRVESELGAGSRFILTLPRADEANAGS